MLTDFHTSSHYVREMAINADYILRRFMKLQHEKRNNCTFVLMKHLFMCLLVNANLLAVFS